MSVVPRSKGRPKGSSKPTPVGPIERLNQSFFSKWMNSFDRYRAIRALQELRLYTLTPRFDAYPRTEEERERIRKTIELVNEQFGVFNHCLYHVEIRVRNILIRFFFGNSSDLDKSEVEQAKKELYRALTKMNKAALVIPMMTNINTPALVHTDLGKYLLGSSQEGIKSVEQQVRESTVSRLYA